MLWARGSLWGHGGTTGEGRVHQNLATRPPGGKGLLGRSPSTLTGWSWEELANPSWDDQGQEHSGRKGVAWTKEDQALMPWPLSGQGLDLIQVGTQP